MLSQRMEQWAEDFIAQGEKKGWLEGQLKGRLEGRFEGKLEGGLEGRLEGEARLLARQLARRFGDLPLWVEQRLKDATEAQLVVWSDAVLDASSLTEVFAEPPANH